MSTVWEILEIEAARLRSQIASPTTTARPPAPTSASVRTSETKTPLDETDLDALKFAALEAELAYRACAGCANVMRHGTPTYYAMRRAALKAQKVMQDALLSLKEGTEAYEKQAALAAKPKKPAADLVADHHSFSLSLADKATRSTTRNPNKGSRR